MSSHLICQQCGNVHSIDEMELSFRRPDAAAVLSQQERENSIQESNDLCVIDGERFFIRAVLPLPVEARERVYKIGLWIEVNQPAFERIYELWDETKQDEEEPFQCYVANSIPTLPETTGLSAEVRLTGPGLRPQIFIQQVEHPLYNEQCLGITAHRAHEYSLLFA